MINNVNIKKISDETFLTLTENSCIPHEFVNRFSELLIHESCKIIVNGGYRNTFLDGKKQLTPYEIATMLRDYFGLN